MNFYCCIKKVFLQPAYERGLVTRLKKLGSGLTALLNRISSRIIGRRLPYLEDNFTSRWRKSLRGVLKDTTQPDHHLFTLLLTERQNRHYLTHGQGWATGTSWCPWMNYCTLKNGFNYSSPRSSMCEHGWVWVDVHVRQLKEWMKVSRDHRIVGLFTGFVDKKKNKGHHPYPF